MRCCQAGFQKAAPASKLSSTWLCLQFLPLLPSLRREAKADLEGLLHKEKSGQGTIPGPARGKGLAEDSGKTELGA